MPDRGDKGDERRQRMEPSGAPEQWQEQTSLSGPEFGQEVYSPQGDHSPQAVGPDAQPGSGPGDEDSGGKVSPDEALGAYRDQAADRGEPVWGPTDDASRPPAHEG